MEKPEPGTMRILGIDPGTRVAGYGVIDVSPRGVLVAVAVGAWNLPIKRSLAERLAQLAIHFRRIASTYQPDYLCIELPFVAANIRSALTLGAARGVILSEAAQRGMGVTEISATSAKKILTGNGYAPKEQVARSLSSLLKVDFNRLPHDATDALAIAYAQATTQARGLDLSKGKGLDGGSSVWEDLLATPAARGAKRGRREGKSGFEKYFGKNS